MNAFCVTDYTVQFNCAISLQPNMRMHILAVLLLIKHTCRFLNTAYNPISIVLKHTAVKHYLCLLLFIIPIFFRRWCPRQLYSTLANSTSQFEMSLHCNTLAKQLAQPQSVCQSRLPEKDFPLHSTDFKINRRIYK